MPVDDEYADFGIQVEERFVLGARSAHQLEDADYFNHGCDPNAGVRGQIILESMREIAVGEEVVFDYAMVLYDGPEGASFYEMDCACGSPRCRGRVTSRDWLIPGLQQRYAGYFSWFLEEKINALAKAATHTDGRDDETDRQVPR